jgi:hypothetical protein
MDWQTIDQLTFLPQEKGIKGQRASTEDMLFWVKYPENPYVKLVEGSCLGRAYKIDGKMEFMLNVPYYVAKVIPTHFARIESPNSNKED